MARIYFEYTKNAVLEHPDYFMFTLFLVTSFTLVSIHDVLNNIPKDSLPHVFNFLVTAIRKTSLAIQVLLAGFLVRVAVGSTMLVYKNRETGLRWLTSKFSEV